MTYAQAMRELRAAGTAQNRKVYARHGVGGPQFGVSYANLGRLAKQIKTDHALALKLWESGNHDARILATMTADPFEATSGLIDDWAAALDSYVLADAFAKFAGKSRFAQAKRRKWSRSRQEWIGRSGWLLIAGAALGRSELTRDEMAGLIERIEAGIHRAKNRVRDAMNSTLIAIGGTHAALTRQALAAAARIGRIEVDHGETGCKTADAAAYIHKMRARATKGR